MIVKAYSQLTHYLSQFAQCKKFAWSYFSLYLVLFDELQYNVT